MSALTLSTGERADISQSLASQYVNRGYRHVAERERNALQESVATASIGSGTSTVTLPTAMMEPISLALITESSQTTGSRTSSYRTLSRVGLERIDIEPWETIGEPAFFAFFGNQIEIRPSSNTTRLLVVRYLAEPSDLTETSSIPSLTTSWREPVLFKAQELVFKELLHDPAKKAEAQADYIAAVSSLKNTEARRESGEYRKTFAPVYPRRTYR